MTEADRMLWKDLGDQTYFDQKAFSPELTSSKIYFFSSFDSQEANVDYDT